MKKQNFEGDVQFHTRKFWSSTELVGGALLTAYYILNRVPHKKLDFIPFELWHGSAPSYHYLKI